MIGDPLVSVIMPAYNRAELISDAVESVLGQAFEAFELILIDDASTDDTLRLMERYARSDPRVRVLQNTANSRIGPIEWEPRNDGLKVARGSFVAYLDSDNTWRPEFLARLAKILVEREEIQLVHCDSCNHYPPGEVEHVIAADSRHLVSRGPDWTVFSHGDLDPAKLGREQYVDTNEMMHRASVFRRLGYLWRTVHSRRDEINAVQGKRRPDRRHNDLDLVERIVAEFSPSAVAHLNEVFVDFYYAGAERPAPRRGPP